MGLIVADTSALLAVLLREKDRPAYLDCLSAAEHVMLSAANYTETGVVYAMRTSPKHRREIDEFIRDAEIEVVPVSAALASSALSAYLRYGKGLHPAGLNYGDCFAYALAKAYDAPLLFKGDDFMKTDIAAAL